MVGTADPTTISEFLSEQWENTPAQEKAPYEAESKRQMKESSQQLGPDTRGPMRKDAKIVGKTKTADMGEMLEHTEIATSTANAHEQDIEVRNPKDATSTTQKKGKL